MKQTIYFKLLTVVSLPIFFFCINDSEISQPDGLHYGSISGKVVHPDNNLIIRVLSEEKIDTLFWDPGSQKFFIDGIKYGQLLLQVEADGYRFFEAKIVLDKPAYICNDIVLARVPSQIAYLYPANSQNLDSEYFDLHEPQVTDSGFQADITFNEVMKTALVNKVLTIYPDSAGVEVIWNFDRSLTIHFPYWKLATVDTVGVSIGRLAENRWDDTLDFDFSVFYPVDTDYIRSKLLHKK
ncbi:MAG: hypothetical protein JW915_14285 [Chitinispirillaceae bacterium]|nr:hypothetical protein [Chitinispirillaceae bacterium]